MKMKEKEGKRDGEEIKKSQGKKSNVYDSSPGLVQCVCVCTFPFSCRNSCGTLLWMEGRCVLLVARVSIWKCLHWQEQEDNYQGCFMGNILLP